MKKYSLIDGFQKDLAIIRIGVLLGHPVQYRHIFS